ncbi:MAG TPA: hypothetical protein VHZ54_13805 [Solirubrobacterales bacterium]|nr:hypothetical protein [Solirubrobacterales bacterium]
MADGPHQPLAWDPHQKLWNRRLTGAIRRRLGSGIPGQAATATVVGIDTLLLAARVEIRRRRRLRGVEAAAEGAPAVLYIDCGLHKRAEQVRQMHDWFGGRFDLRIVGFEASAAHMRDAEAALAGIDGLELHQVALVGPDFDEPTVKLYRSTGEGAGDSLFGERGEEFEHVPARRLTELLTAQGHEVTAQPVLLRMNIEGAEQFVISDLVAAGVTRSVDGYYGMWDDLSKIDPDADVSFRGTLKRERIFAVTFNDRDLIPHFLRTRAGGVSARLAGWIFGLRRAVIKKDLETSILVGLARTASR